MPSAEQINRMTHRLATEKAALFQNEVLLPQMAKILQLPMADAATVRDAFSEPYASLRVIYGHYAFSRRGMERTLYAQFAMEALLRTVGSPDKIEKFLRNGKPEHMWTSFEDVCRENSRKTSEQLNRGMLEGFIEMAQEIYTQDSVGSIFSWVQEGVVQTRHIEQQFLRMVDIRGIGPKLASVILRDVVWMFNLEGDIEWSDRLFLQPIDIWVRKLADYITTEVHSETTADWVIAGKLAKAARLAGVSSVALNHGIQYFGNNEVRSMPNLQEAVYGLMSAPTGPASDRNRAFKPPR
ncbi:MAG: hypothetical protein WCO51_12460 [bacterium]